MAQRPPEGKGKEGLVKPPEQPRGWPAVDTQALRKSEAHGDMDMQSMEAYQARMKAQEALVRRGQSQGVHRYDDATTITGAVTSKE